MIDDSDPPKARYRSLRQLAGVMGWEPTVGNILDARFVLFSDPPSRGMEAHYFLEQIEKHVRLEMQRVSPRPVAIWLNSIDLFVDTFTTDLVEAETESYQEQHSQHMSLKLIGLAGTSSKAALDLACCGYFHASVGIIRSMVEAWLRVDAMRVQPSLSTDYEASVRAGKRHFTWPADDKLEALNQDERYRGSRIKARKQFQNANYGSHPSLEGTETLWADDLGTELDFGPQMQVHQVDGLMSSGVGANLSLLRELTRLTVPTKEWLGRLNIEEQRYRRWSNDTYDAEPFVQEHD